MVRSVISTREDNGTTALTEGVIFSKDHNTNFQNRSVLIVESNERCIMRSQGQITDEFGPGSQNLNTPNTGIGNMAKRLNYGGNIPWIVEAIFFSMARFEGITTGISQSKQLIPMEFEVAYYFKVSDPKLLLQNVQLHGDSYTTKQLENYISPFIDQAVSQIVNLIPVEKIYLKLQDITNAVTATLSTHMKEIGIELIYSRFRSGGFESGEIEELKDEQKQDEVPKLIDDIQAMRIALAEILANKGDPAATNMMLGVPYYNVAIFGSGIPTAPGTVVTPGTR